MLFFKPRTGGYYKNQITAQYWSQPPLYLLNFFGFQLNGCNTCWVTWHVFAVCKSAITLASIGYATNPDFLLQPKLFSTFLASSTHDTFGGKLVISTSQSHAWRLVCWNYELNQSHTPHALAPGCDLSLVTSPHHIQSASWNLQWCTWTELLGGRNTWCSYLESSVSPDLKQNGGFAYKSLNKTRRKQLQLQI